MPQHIAFLRAINLGKVRKVPMAELRAWLAAAGFTDVETHIQTGNVRLGTPMRSRAKVETEVERVLAERAGFEVPTVVLSPRELAELYAAAEGLGVTAQRRYVSFLKDEPGPEAQAVIDAWDAPGEGARVLGRAVYWWIDHPTRAARFSNARVERHIGTATTRDLKVVSALAERWGA